MNLKTVRYVFPQTLPILTGYLFLGAAYGIFLTASGLPSWYAMITPLLIYGGSMEYVMVAILSTRFAPMTTFLVALMVQARHLFYGIAMLEKLKDTPWRYKWYIIYAMSDETFALNSSMEIPDDLNRDQVFFTTSLLDQFYWFCGCTIGALFGQWINFPTIGIDFVMTAMFIVIAFEELRKHKRYLSASVGLFASIGCLLLFGPSQFLLPTMAVILAFLWWFTQERKNA